MNLFDLIEAQGPQIVHNDEWRPESPPCLDGIHEIELDCETTGLRWFEKDRPIGISICLPNGKAQYLPWGHRGLGNLDEAVVKRWAQTELRGKRITNLNIKFDIHMLREWGVDLEAQGNEVSDVGHYSALLNDHSKNFSLENISREYLGEGKLDNLDKSRMASYSAGAVAAYAEQDVLLVNKLKKIMLPLMDVQNLQRVRALEDKVIFVTAEMEKNGSPIDIELLDRWIHESQKQLEIYLWKIARAVGFQVNPDSPKDCKRVFEKLKLPMGTTATGRASFTDAVLKEIDHPVVQDMRRAGKLMSLRSKYLVNTKKAVGADGILRYSLHQLRAAKDDYADAGEGGTVTGRFSSTKIVDDVGCNIQQRMKAAKQRVSFGYEEDDISHDEEIFIVRKLHTAGNGLLFSSDMDQAQYRIFASYADNPKIIEAYRQNPSMSFHKYMWNLLKPYAALTYRQQKDLNFAYLFGAGVTKMSLMMGHITQLEFDQIRITRQYNHPKLKLTKEVKRIYEREVPEVVGLLARSSHLAKPMCDDNCKIGDVFHRTVKHQGFVEDAIGRRMRFPLGNRVHKSFNGIDQMTEASYMKQKLVELHEVRQQTGFVLRITNHDEVVGDIPDKRQAQVVHDLLNLQSFPELKVPLTWSTGIGPNWAECEDL